jgi:hypothetical protein
MACFNLCFLEILINDADVLNLLIISYEAHFQFCGYIISVMCCTVQAHEHHLQFFQALAHKFLA